MTKQDCSHPVVMYMGERTVGKPYQKDGKTYQNYKVKYMCAEPGCRHSAEVDDARAVA